MWLPSVSLRAHRWRVLGLVVAMAAVLAVWLMRPKKRQPQSLDDVLQAARELGLHVRGDGVDGSFGNRLILSETGPETMKVADLVLGIPSRAGHQRTVAVYLDHRDETDLLRSQPENAAMWGGYFVYGDAALIRRLLNHRKKSKELSETRKGDSPCNQQPPRPRWARRHPRGP